MDRTAIALGTFDGVHSGHRAVIGSAVKSGFKAVAVTFKTPPKAFFDKSIGLLMSPDEKKERLQELGISETLFMDFSEFKEMSAEDFLKFLTDKFSVSKICCGFNYRFGNCGKGDTALLEEFCNKNGIVLTIIPPVLWEEKQISSTLIREMLKNGEIKKANKLLCCPFGFTGEIIHGDARGRTIGFPTVNQRYPEYLTKVKFGVYKSVITVEGKKYKAITNIGVRPTYETEYVSAETHIIDFSGDIYGKKANLQLLEFLREEKKFDSLDELKNAIEQDIIK